MSDLTFDPVQRTGYLLWQTFHALDQDLNAALAEFDLTLLQFSALVNIVLEPGISAAEIARRNNSAPQSVQTSLKPLLDRELIERRPHPVHGRVLGVHPLPAGAALVERAGVVVDEVESRMMRDFSASDIETLHGLLLRTLTAVHPLALDRSSIRQQ